VLAAKRRELIVETVRRTGAVRVSELTQALGVSDMTIRRDLDALDRAGLLEKVHGGATVTSSTHEPGFEAKSLREKPEKLAIARAAARLVEPGGAVALSAGTTTWTLAHELRAVPRLTVVTNSTEVAEVLYHGPREDQTVLLTGGLRTPSGALVGPLAIQALRELNLDLVFMGVHGIDEEAGFTTPNLMEAETNRALIHAGRRLVVVADSTKWGVVGMSTYATLEEADVLVTDEQLPADARDLLEERVGELVLAPQDSSPLPLSDDEAERERVGSAP
jgi:DeoR/GlpR family transcriptional regulator of sugar metabolism